jgi:acetate kinase
LKLLVINSGSSSIKFEVFEKEGCRLTAGGLLEKIGTAEARLRQKRRLEDGTFDLAETVEPVSGHAAGFDLIGRVNSRNQIFTGESDLFGIGHRVVHGGERFQEPTLITGEVIAAIRELIPLAPLHNPANLLGIEVLRESFPRVPQVAVFDTMFHQTLPPPAFHYALPFEFYENHHVRRYGFHGTSHAYVAGEAAGYLRRDPEETNLITLHLGNGASAAAIKNGRSIDTSMGLTPLEGLVMGTRCGDVDPALHFYLLRETGMTPEELEGLLNTRSGLQGLCGSNDMREILEQGSRGNDRARLAVDLFCYRIKKYIGAYVAVLGRVDAVVFTGGIGENAPAIREKIMEGMEHLGMAVDPEKNRNVSGSIAEIQPERMPANAGAKDFLPLLVIKTNEELEIARQTLRVIERRGGSRRGGSRTALTRTALTDME